MRRPTLTRCLGIPFARPAVERVGSDAAVDRVQAGAASSVPRRPRRRRCCRWAPLVRVVVGAAWSVRCCSRCRSRRSFLPSIVSRSLAKVGLLMVLGARFRCRSGLGLVGLDGADRAHTLPGRAHAAEVIATGAACDCVVAGLAADDVSGSGAVERVVAERPRIVQPGRAERRSNVMLAPGASEAVEQTMVLGELYVA